MLKKLLSIVIVFSILFCSVCSNAFVVEATENDTNSGISSAFDLKSSTDFVAELEEEGIAPENSEEYDISLLIGVEENSTVDPNYLNSSNIIVGNNIDDALKAHREKVRDFYVPYNEDIVTRLGLNEYDYCVSFYSPYIEILFDDVGEYMESENDLLESLQENQDFILSASNSLIYELVNDDAVVNNSEYSVNYPLSKAFEDIGVSNTQYTGQGIKVGVVESGIPNNTANLKEGYYTFLHSRATKHATVVSSIIGGTTGIAENVYFYFASSVGFVENLNTLINTYEMNIVNMSFGKTLQGYYTDREACIDDIVCSTGCTIVKSAGNNGDKLDWESRYFVTSPGCAMNAITVGSIDYNKNIRHSSSWFTSSGFLLKPDVVAPGGILWDIDNIPNIDGNVVGHSGTSFSAPMVTGTIALLMEEFPMLKINPALVKSVVHLGAEMLPSQSDYFDEKAGFGLINYQNMRECLLYINFYKFTVLPTASEGDVVLSYTVAIPNSKCIQINANAIVPSSYQIGNSTYFVPEYTDYSIKVYDLETLTCVASSTIDSSTDYLTYLNESLTNSSFRIDIVLESDNVSGKTEVGVIAYDVYDHQYDGCILVDSTSHKKVCECGEYIIENHELRYVSCNNNDYHLRVCNCGYQANSPHVVNPTSLKRAPCILCGAMVTIGNNTMQPWGNDCEESPY